MCRLTIEPKRCPGTTFSACDATYNIEIWAGCAAFDLWLAGKPVPNVLAIICQKESTSDPHVMAASSAQKTCDWSHTTAGWWRSRGNSFKKLTPDAFKKRYGVDKPHDEEHCLQIIKSHPSTDDGARAAAAKAGAHKCWVKREIVFDAQKREKRADVMAFHFDRDLFLTGSILELVKYPD